MTNENQTPAHDDAQVEGHGMLLGNVNETVESDDEVEGHAKTNVNETIESDEDAKAHTRPRPPCQ